jgi:hypothetical protein
MTKPLHSVSIERLQQIEQERQITLSDPLYYKWMQELGVSSSWKDPTPILNARETMRHWDSRRLNLEPVSRLLQ